MNLVLVKIDVTFFDYFRKITLKIISYFHFKVQSGLRHPEVQEGEVEGVPCHGLLRHQEAKDHD